MTHDAQSTLSEVPVTQAVVEFWRSMAALALEVPSDPWRHHNELAVAMLKEYDDLLEAQEAQLAALRENLVLVAGIARRYMDTTPGPNVTAFDRERVDAALSSHNSDQPDREET